MSILRRRQNSSSAIPIRWTASTLSRWWLLVPIATLGFGTCVPFFIVAKRTRIRRLSIIGGAYAAVAFLSLYLLNFNGNNDRWQSSLGRAIAITCAAVGTAHVFGIRRQLGAGSQVGGPRMNFSQLPGAYTNSTERSNYVIARGVERMALREAARQIVLTQPRLADELRIGRPDLPREFDDGGLVDINHVPASVLAQLPDVSRNLALRIVDARQTIDCFESLDDISLVLGMPPQKLDHLRDVALFRL